MEKHQPTGNAAANQPACIWMQAGVVCRKYCDLNFDCAVCTFDRAMNRAAEENHKTRQAGKIPRGEKSAIVYWKDKLRARPAGKRPCLHHMKGHIDFRTCALDYQCGKCEFDQYFNDQYSVHALLRPVEVLNVEGFRIPQGFYLHRGHAWLKVEENSEVRLGLDDFALRLLGPLSDIEAPLMGKETRRDRADILLRKGPRETRMLSPVSGVITAVNPALRDNGSQANKDPYSAGWILRVHADNLRQDLKHLMIGEETEAFLSREVDRLYQVIEEEIGPLAADGGMLGNDIAGHLPEKSWSRLTGMFLRP
ncbi:MAG: glycine cleavage system protein H [Thermodesulfobacteriota bacterium]